MDKPTMPPVDVESYAKKCSMTFGRSQIVYILQLEGYDIPDDSKVTVQVPGGGDYSGETLTIGTDTFLKISWTEKKEP